MDINYSNLLLSVSDQLRVYLISCHIISSWNTTYKIVKYNLETTRSCFIFLYARLTCYAQDGTVRRIKLKYAERLVLSPFAKGFAVHHNIRCAARGCIDASAFAQLLLGLMMPGLQQGARARCGSARCWCLLNATVAVAVAIDRQLLPPTGDRHQLRRMRRLRRGARANVTPRGRRVCRVFSSLYRRRDVRAR